MTDNSTLFGAQAATRLRIGASVIALAAAVAAPAAIAQTTPPAADPAQAPTVTRPPEQNTAQSSSPDGQGTPVDNVPGTTEEAQTTPTETVGDDIVVTGYRQALQSAQQIKRNSDAIVDSVTAEDIGALPDRSVVETLQRIPGVSISRFAAGVDPDHFSSEGSGATVRGLTYVRSEFNGREAFSALNGRSLGFQDVPSELLGGVDVFKSPTADRIEGGISGIVNLRTRKPFDTAGTYIAGTIENNYGDFVRKSAPTLSLLGSTRWKTGIGDIGILGSIVYSQLFTRSDRIQLSSFRNRPIFSNGTRTDVVAFDGATQRGTGLFPRGAVMGSDDRNRERYGYAGALQWRSNDGSMEAAFQFLRSDARLAWTENVIEIATDNVTAAGDSRARAGTSVSFDEDDIFDQGLITGPTGWRADQQNEPGPIGGVGTNGNATLPAGRRTPAFGLQSNNQFREHLEKSVTDDYGFNFKWDVSDRLGLVFDYSHVESTGEVVDNTLWTTTYQDAFIDVRGSDTPIVRFVPPQNCDTSLTNAAGVCQGTPGLDGNFPTYFTGANQSFTDPANSFWRNTMDHVEESEGNSDAFRIDADYAFPESTFLKSVRVGYRYANRKQVARNSTYNWGVLSEQWGNGGPVWLDEPTGGVGGDQQGNQSQEGTYRPYFWDNFFRGQAVNPAQGTGRLFYGGRPASNYQELINFSKRIRDEWLAPDATTGIVPTPTGGSTGWVPLAERPGVIQGTYYLPGEVNPIEETNHAAYIMARFDTEFGNGMRFNGNVGVRYSDTRRTSTGFVQFPTTDPLTPDANCVETIRQIVNPAAGETPPAQPTIAAGCAFLYSNPQLRANARAFANSASVANDVNTNYDYWLPAVNLRLEVGNGLQFRAAYFKGISPPNTRDIRNYTPVTIGAQVPVGALLTVVPNTNTADPNDGIIQGENQVVIEGRGVRGGAPDLLPVTSDNFDLTAEWYFNKVGSLTLSGFYKRVKGVVVFDTQRQSFTNAGQTFDTVFTRELNSADTGEVYGLEAAYQQTYDFLPGALAGLGLQANYTYVKSSGVSQPTLAAGDPAVAGDLVSNVDVSGFPLQGLSKHNFNITPFYDWKGLSLRASYAWRSQYLLTTRDVITPFDPVFQEAYGQLDASIFYQVTENLRLGVQGVNLTSSLTKTSVAVQGPDGVDDIRIIPRGWFINDRRISAIVRFNF
ncbi:TonB-dependent receptor [Sphingomonas guangdongensis]|uniref:TonB-dependent receptor n=1 Tax=Sphingomonas guangdongensis TaxID=1141890 RepID=A0A285R4Y7_9SPHN|nr:TonB-dependent receptor [Sphingomonas guangdongensis]SOB87412.1 TonB-dependent receptor [Sphingomonas guangdongensis]